MHLVQLIDSLRWGGAQVLMLTFARASQAKNIRLTIISLTPPYPDVPLAEEIQAHGAQVQYFPGGGLLDLNRLRNLRHYLIAEEVDVMHSHLTYANIIGPWVGKRAKIPLIASLHNERYKESDNSIRRSLETLSLRLWADRILTVGHAVQHAQRERFPNRPLPVVPNAVLPIPDLPSAERSSLRADLLHGKTGPLLISVGQLIHQKGYEVLLEAMKMLRAEFPESVLVVAGGGEYRSHLEDLASSLDLTGRVYFLGKRDDVPRLLGAADLYVNSSRWEGLPLSVLEAMSAGLPVVATEVGDVPRVLSPQAGRLVICVCLEAL